MNALGTIFVILLTIAILTSKYWTPVVYARREAKKIEKRRQKQERLLDRRREGEKHSPVPSIAPVQSRTPTSNPSSAKAASPQIAKELIEASDRGDEQATRKIQEMYNQYNTAAMRQAIAKARLEAYSSKAIAGDIEAKRWVGISYFDIGNENSGYSVLSRLADQGDTKAMQMLAQQYTPFGYYGDHPEKYLEWILRAAEAGDAEAQNSAGIELDAQGNYAEAMKWYQKAAEQGYEKAYANLSDDYYQEAVTADFSDKERAKKYREEAVYWAQKGLSAPNGIDYEDAIPLLSRLSMLLQDQGLSVFNPKKACMAFEQAIAMSKAIGRPYQELQASYDSAISRFSPAISEEERQEWIEGI